MGLPSQWQQRPVVVVVVVVGADTPRIQIQYLQSGKTAEKLRETLPINKRASLL